MLLVLEMFETSWVFGRLVSQVVGYGDRELSSTTPDLKLLRFDESLEPKIQAWITVILKLNIPYELFFVFEYIQAIRIW
jgi:hypothetical protein